MEEETSKGIDNNNLSIKQNNRACFCPNKKTLSDYQRFQRAARQRQEAYKSIIKQLRQQSLDNSSQQSLADSNASVNSQRL